MVEHGVCFSSSNTAVESPMINSSNSHNMILNVPVFSSKIKKPQFLCGENDEIRIYENEISENSSSNDEPNFNQDGNISHLDICTQPREENLLQNASKFSFGYNNIIQKTFPEKKMSKRKSSIPRRRLKIPSEEELVEREVTEYLLKIPAWEKILPKPTEITKPSSSSSTESVSNNIVNNDNQDFGFSNNHLPIQESEELAYSFSSESNERSFVSAENSNLESAHDNSDASNLNSCPGAEIALESQPEKPKVKKRAICDECGKSFGRPSDLRRHMVLHTGEKNHKCEECQKEFSQRYHLVRHTKNVHKKEIESLVCGVCNMTFNSEYLLTRHVKSHGVMTFVCEVCSKDFKTKRQMKEHILAVHVGNKPFKCTQCEKTFARKYHLERHLLMHSGTKNFQCEYCGKDFGTKGNLLAHVRRVHLQIKEFTCGICQKGFYSPKDLQTHIKVHTGEKPWQCQICLKRFSERVNMEWHMRIHSGDRPFQCEHCDKSYTRLPHLLRHKKEGLCFFKDVLKYRGKKGGTDDESASPDENDEEDQSEKHMEDDDYNKYSGSNDMDDSGEKIDEKIPENNKKSDFNESSNVNESHTHFTALNVPKIL